MLLFHIILILIAMKLPESCKQEKKPGQKYRSELRCIKVRRQYILTLGHKKMLKMLRRLSRKRMRDFFPMLTLSIVCQKAGWWSHARGILKWHRNIITECTDRSTRCRSTLKALWCEMTSNLAIVCLTILFKENVKRNDAFLRRR